MNGKVSIGQWIIGILLAIVSSMGGVIFGLQNSKIKKVEEKIDKEVEDRETEGTDQYKRINDMQEVVTRTDERVYLIAKHLKIPIKE